MRNSWTIIRFQKSYSEELELYEYKFSIITTMQKIECVTLQEDFSSFKHQRFLWRFRKFASSCLSVSLHIWNNSAPRWTDLNDV